MGNWMSRFRLLLNPRRRPPVGRLTQRRLLAVRKKPAAPPEREHPGAPASAPRPYQRRRPLPATFKITPKMHLPLPDITNLRLGVFPVCGPSWEKPVLRAPNTTMFGRRSAVRIPGPGRHFDILRVPSMRALKPAPPAPLASPQGEALKEQQDPEMASEEDEGGKARPKERSGIPCGGAPSTSTSCPPPDQLQALKAEEGPAGASSTNTLGSPEPSAPHPDGHVQPPGGPHASAPGPVALSCVPGKAAECQQPADPGLSSPEAHGPVTNASLPQAVGRRPIKRSQPCLLETLPVPLRVYWDRGEDPPPAKLPCLALEYFYTFSSTDWQPNKH